MMPCVVKTENLVKSYGHNRALDGFSLAVPARSTTGLVGCNGAGKTTWMMTVAGFVLPHSGTVDILGLGPFDAARHGGRLSVLPQDSELPPDACPRELLVRYALLQGVGAAAAARAADSLLEAFNLSSHALKPVRALSHGMRKRVMVAQAFIGDPDIVLLDEPLSGLDPVEAGKMRAFIHGRRTRQTIVISSHNLDDIEKLCTHVAFIADGRLTRFDTLSAFTGFSGRVVYTLKRKPDDFPALKRLVDGITFVWHDGKGELTAEFPDSCLPEEVNERLLPPLLPFGVVSVVSGRTLEEACFGELSPPFSPRKMV